MDRDRVRLSDFYVDQELARVVRDLAAELGVPVAALCRSSLRLLVRLTAERAVLAAREGVGEVPARSCVVCRMPRRPDPIEDSLAHAQCLEILGRLEKELVDA